MRTLGVLAAGWLVGGLVIVLLTRQCSAPAVVAPVAPQTASVSGVAASPPRTMLQTLGDAARGLFGGTPVAPKPAEVSLPATPVAGGGGPAIIPVAGVTRSELRDTYSQARGSNRVHNAIDILAPRGTPVLAAVPGKVRKLFVSKGGGITVYQFDRNEEFVYYYAHLDGYADGLHEGQYLQQGDVLGYVGVTGNAPVNTPHLHFSIERLPPDKQWSRGTAVNPYPILGGVPPGASPALAGTSATTPVSARR